MALYANPPKDGGDFVRILAPAGLQGAVCCDVVDQGEKEQEWQGVTKMVPKISLHFLLGKVIPAKWKHPHTGETVDVHPDLVGRPFGVSRWFTNSLSEKANLRQFLAAWRGQDFSPSELVRFDLESLISVPAGLNIVHKQSQDGTKWYANLHSALLMPEGFEAPGIPADYVRIKDRPPREDNGTPKSEPRPIEAKSNDVGYGPDYDFSGEPINEPADDLPF